MDLTSIFELLNCDFSSELQLKETWNRQGLKNIKGFCSIVLLLSIFVV